MEKKPAVEKFKSRRLVLPLQTCQSCFQTWRGGKVDIFSPGLLPCFKLMLRGCENGPKFCVYMVMINSGEDLVTIINGSFSWAKLFSWGRVWKLWHRKRTKEKINRRNESILIETVVITGLNRAWNWLWMVTQFAQSIFNGGQIMAISVVFSFFYLLFLYFINSLATQSYFDLFRCEKNLLFRSFSTKWHSFHCLKVTILKITFECWKIKLLSAGIKN